jgi:hypothetical protein
MAMLDNSSRSIGDLHLILLGVVMNMQEPFSGQSLECYLAWLKKDQFRFFLDQGLTCDLIFIKSEPGTHAQLVDSQLKPMSHPNFAVPFIPGKILTQLCETYGENMLNLIGDLFDSQQNEEALLSCFCALESDVLPPEKIGIGDSFPYPLTEGEWVSIRDGSASSELRFAIPLFRQRSAQNYREAFLQAVLIPVLRRASWEFLEIRTLEL